MFGKYYTGKKVLITGHTGFKGAWLSLWLRDLGANVYGFSLPLDTTPNLHEVLISGTFSDETFGNIGDYSSVDLSLIHI